MRKGDVSTESYKGVRDFYPRDAFVHDYILETMARVCERFGFEHYNASVLESTELYTSKTSDEIVNEQTYTFTDRGERSVTLRPEMTPTLARMVAAQRRELPLPIRWYSIPNVFRYERPQRGRLREHWQLNADMFGVGSVDAEVEMMLLSAALMHEFGADDSQFEIRVSDRRILENVFNECGLDENQKRDTMRLLDRRGKMDESDFARALNDAAGANAEKLLDLLTRATSTPELEELTSRLRTLGIQNVVIDTGITRGFDYYSGVVFEVFDTSPENNRSLFGGGRYDHLLEMFGVEPLPTVGFGMGDVTMRDFLETHNLLPAYMPATEIMICVVDEHATDTALKLATTLRQNDVNTAVNTTGKKVGDQIKAAEKLEIPFIICVGETEVESEMVVIKHLPTHTEKEIAKTDIADYIFEFTTQ